MTLGAGTVVITGGAGYIGAHLVDELSPTYSEIIVLDKKKYVNGIFPSNVKYFQLNLSDSDATEIMTEIFNKLSLNSVVIHLAAEKSVEDSVLFPDYYELENFVSTKRLLAAMAQSGLKNLIFASTAAVYDESVSNNQINELDAIKPASPYASTKLASEELIRNYTLTNFHFAILRFFNVAGAKKASLIERGGKNLIPNLIHAAQNDEEFYIYGNDYPTADGTCTRDFIDIRDLMTSIILCLHAISDHNLGVINIGSGRGYSVLEVVSEVQNIFPSLKYSFNSRRIGDVASVVADITLAKKLLGWSPIYSLQDMITSVISQ